MSLPTATSGDFDLGFDESLSSSDPALGRGLRGLAELRHLAHASAFDDTEHPSDAFVGRLLFEDFVDEGEIGSDFW